VASGNPSDLVYLGRGLIGSYAAQGALRPLDDLISEVGIDTSEYRKPAMTETTVDGKVYDIPESFRCGPRPTARTSEPRRLTQPG
jgi:multiple sugar transport system substrate-binding protein